MKVLLFLAVAGLVLGLFLAALAEELQAALEDMRERFSGGEE